VLDRTVFTSIGQCILAVLVLPLAIFDCFSSMQNSSLLFSIVGGVGHALCLLGGSVVEQQFNSCILATKLRFLVLNQGLIDVKRKYLEKVPTRKHIYLQPEFILEIKRIRLAHLKLCQLFQLIGDIYQSM